MTSGKKMGPRIVGSFSSSVFVAGAVLLCSSAMRTLLLHIIKYSFNKPLGAKMALGLGFERAPYKGFYFLNLPLKVPVFRLR